MKKLLLLLCFSLTLFGGEIQSLDDYYQFFCKRPSDIHEHLPVMKKLSGECDSVIEIGVRSMVSTWAWLRGLSERPDEGRSYIGIDLVKPPLLTLEKAQELAEENGIAFQFWQANDMEIELEEADLLFIDSLHTYCHLTYELETFSGFIRKYIVLHDTSDPWGDQDDNSYLGNYSEYPPSIDRTKRGLWPAVVDFLSRHPEWKLHRRYLNNHGLTILRRL